MRTLLYFLLLTLGWSSVMANAPAAELRGILILKDVAGYPANAVSFVDIQWVNTSGGYATDAAGNKTPFINDGIGTIIYLNQVYYDEVDHNQYWLNWRAGLQNHEVVILPVSDVSLGPDDLPRVQAQVQQWDGIAQQNPAGKSLIAPIVATLNDDITKLSGGYVLRNGKWLTLKDADTQSVAPSAAEANKPVTFTTKDGKKYVDARVIATNAGITVITSDGGASLTYAQMPDDLTGFPKEVQSEIQARQVKTRPVVVAAPADSSSPDTGFLDSASSFVKGIYRGIVSFFSSTPPSAPPASSSTNGASTNAAPPP